MPAEQAIRNISDTAIWAALYRARETERKGALFRDPFARRLAGEEQILRDEKPACALERVRLDLADRAARRELFRKLGERSKKGLIIAEGLLIYLNEAEVGELASDLAAPESFQDWVLDIASPGLLRLLQREVGSELDRANAPLKFAPAEGPPFFARYGWRPVAVRSPLKEAAREKRLPLLLRVIALLPESSGSQGSRPWSGICLLEKQRS